GEFCFGDVFELFAVELADGLIEFFEDAEAFGGDAGTDDATVAGIALAGNQAAAFGAGQQAGGVGGAGGHFLPGEVAGDAFAVVVGAFAVTAENAEDVVLRAGEVERLEEVLESAEEEVRGAENVKGDFLFEAVEGFELVDFFKKFSGHGITIDVATT